MPHSPPAYASLLDYVTVLPRAHVRLGDVRWQYALYDVFHSGTPSRLTHALGMTPNTMLWMMLASLVVPGPLDGGLLVAALVVALGAWYDRLVGVLLVAITAGLWLLGQHLIAGWGAAALANTLLAAAALALFQAGGHAFEPIPPPWSGTNTFVPLGTFLRTASLPRILLLPSMTFFGAALEFWASPRLLQVQLLKILVALGYRPELRREVAVREVAYRADIRYAVEDRLPA